MRKCSYCKEPSHDIRKCPHRERHIPLVRECAKLFFTSFFTEIESSGVGHMSILRVRNKPHYFFSRERNEYVYEPNRNFVAGTAGSLYDSNKTGSKNTFAVTSMPMANSGLFGSAFTNAFPVLRRMAEKMYYNLWAVRDHSQELSADMKRQKPKNMSEKDFRRILKSIYHRDKFIEITSLPLAPKSRPIKTHLSYASAYHKSDLREREIIKINTPFLDAASLYCHRQSQVIFSQLESHNSDCIKEVCSGQMSKMELLEMFLQGIHRELSCGYQFLQLTENIEVVSPSGVMLEKKQKSVDLAVDITEQQWYDVVRSFIKRVDETIALSRRHYKQ